MDNSRKIQNLREEIAESENLLKDWRAKKRLAENPNEAKRCEIAIEKLAKEIAEYEGKLAKLESSDTMDTKKKEGKRIIHTQNYFENVKEISKSLKIISSIIFE